MAYSVIPNVGGSMFAVVWNHEDGAQSVMYECDNAREANRVEAAFKLNVPDGPDLFNVSDAKKVLKKARKAAKEPHTDEPQVELGR